MFHLVVSYTCVEHLNNYTFIDAVNRLLCSLRYLK